jgi:2-isopropylmalate synthase
VAHRERVTGQPYVGKAAFAHKGGMHVHAVQKNAATYEHVPPESVGNRRAILVSELSGLSNIQNRVSTILSLDHVGRDSLKQILETVARMEREGYAYENADASFELLALRLLGRAAPHFTLDNYQCGVLRRQNSSPVTTGHVTVRVGDMVRRGTAEGEDPLQTLEHALREALCPQFSALEHVRLVDRRFRPVERPGAQLTRVRVSTDFTDGNHYWTTMAVGQNVIDACIESLVEGLEYCLVSSGRVVVSEEPSDVTPRVV